MPKGNKDRDDDNECHESPLAVAVCDLACAIRDGVEQRKIEFEWAKSHHGFATKHDLVLLERNIMSAISDFSAKQTAFNDRQSAAVDAAVASVTALTGDIQVLNDKITELQNSTGGVTPEDQALIDDLVVKGEAAVAKTEAVAAALAALDNLTPPKPPVA